METKEITFCELGGHSTCCLQQRVYTAACSGKELKGILIDN